jgi:lipopolysaccharide transport system ATP-binding protein
MTGSLIEAANLSKRYKLYAAPSDRLIEWLSFGRTVRHTDFWALRDFNLTVKPGECVGVIGANGAGKSTLLKILSGTVSPTAGSFKVQGNVLSLLELGGGFSADMTGRQNVIEAASLLGFPRGHVHDRMDQIIEFAQLGDFFDRPMRFYSSGMGVRLAFSMYAFFDPDVLIIDEALAVGDAAFQRKCFRRIQELVENEHRAVLLVSHDMQSMIKFCNRIYWLHQGVVRMAGEPSSVVQEYLRFMFSTNPTEPEKPATKENGKGLSVAMPAEKLARSPAAIVYDSDGVELLGVWLEHSDGQVSATVPVNQPFTLNYCLRFHRPVSQPVFGIQLATTRGERLVATNTKMMQKRTEDFTAGQTAIIRWPIAPGLAVGDYFLSCGCSLHDDLYRFLMREVDGYQFSVVGSSQQSGLCSLNGEPRIERIA